MKQQIVFYEQFSEVSHLDGERLIPLEHDQITDAIRRFEAGELQCLLVPQSMCTGWRVYMGGRARQVTITLPAHWGHDFAMQAYSRVSAFPRRENINHKIGNL